MDIKTITEKKVVIAGKEIPVIALAGVAVAVIGIGAFAVITKKRAA